MKSLAELAALREQMKASMNMRHEDSDKIRVVVGMATCGIAAGARPVLGAFVDEIAKRSLNRTRFDFAVGNMDFLTRERNCGGCSNNCEVICVYRNGRLIDFWGNRCERGAARTDETPRSQAGTVPVE